MIATKDDLETLAIEDKPDVPAMKGWRHEIFGKDVQALKDGSLTLGLHKGRIRKVVK